MQHTLLTQIQYIIKQYSFHWQFFAIICAFMLAYAFYNFSSKFLFPRIKEEIDKNIASSADKAIIKYVQPLISHLLSIIFLSIVSVTLLKFEQNITIITASIKVLFLLLFIRFLKISFNHPIVIEIATFILVPILILSILNLLGPTIAYLDSYNFAIGSIRLSIYSIIKAIIMLVVIFWGASFISAQIKKYIENDNTLKLSTKGVLRKIIDLATYFIVFLVILKVIGIDGTTFAVIGGAVGVGVGFGLQRIVSNFIGGIILLFEKSVKIGDLLELEDGTIGTITHFGGRYVLIETFAGKEIMIPNETVVTSKVTNLTHKNSKGRIEIELVVSYSCDLQKARDLIKDVAQNYTRCILYPPVSVYLSEFKDYGIEIKLFFWVSNVENGMMEPKSDVMTKILEEFDKANIKISYPKMDIIQIPINNTKSHL